MGAAPYYYLFANPSFLSGIARTIDLGGHFDAYNFSRTPEEADIEEIADDWRRVYESLKCTWENLIRDNPDFVRELGEAAHLPAKSALPAVAPSKRANEQIARKS